MKRTYVDILGEYYDYQDDILNMANEYDLRAVDLQKVFRSKKTLKKQRLID